MLEPQPATSVVFETPKGKLELQLWTKEIACARKFVEKCSAGFSGGLTFSTGVHDDVIEAQASTIEYDMELESHPRISFSQRGYVGALKDEKSGKVSADGIFITMKEIPTFHRKYTVIGKVTTDAFYTVLKITESEQEDGKLIYLVSAKPMSIDGDKSRVQKVEPVRAKSSNAKKTKRRVALDYDEHPDVEVKRVKMKLAHELLRRNGESEKGEESEEKSEQEREKNGEIHEDEKNAVNKANDGEKNDKDKTKEKLKKNETDKRDSNTQDEPAERAKVTKDNAIFEPENTNQPKQPSKSSKRRRSFAYNPALDFDSSDEAPPANLKTHIFE